MYKPKPRPCGDSAGLLIAVHLIEAIKDHVELVLGNAPSGIANGHLEAFGIRWSLVEAEVNLTSGRGKLDGIGGEIGQHLQDALLVEGDGRQVWLTITTQADAFSLRRRGQHFHHSFNQRRQRHRWNSMLIFPVSSRVTSSRSLI
jgi:hypothetical protein